MNEELTTEDIEKIYESLIMNYPKEAHSILKRLLDRIRQAKP